MHFIIVRRGNEEKFQFLRETFAKHQVEIFWDRRLGERRRRTEPAPVEQRLGVDRRRPLADSWSTLDFILARPGQPPDASLTS